MTPLLIGQAPSASGIKEPLAGHCGQRLADLCGVTIPRYLHIFRRMNLLETFPGKNGKGDIFDRDAAGIRIMELRATKILRRGPLVLLGNNVASAFGVEGEPPLTWFASPDTIHGIAICPHPSGINRWWNDPKNVKSAENFWHALAELASSARV